MTAAKIIPTSASGLNLSCTSAALKHIRDKLAAQPEATALRIRLKKSGCSGWLYQFGYGTQPESDEIAYTVADGFIVFIQREYVSFFKNAILDYVQSGFNRTLTCINPNEGIRCGCGESFTVNTWSDERGEP